MHTFYKGCLIAIVLAVSAVVFAQTSTPTPPPPPVFATPTLTPIRLMPSVTPAFRPSQVPLATPTAFFRQPVEGQPIAFGETVEAVLETSTPVNRYSFRGERGQIALVTLTYQHNFIHLNAFIELGFNRIYPMTTTSNTQVFILPSAGDYTLVVNGSYGSDLFVEVPYTLTLNTPAMESIAYGDTVETTLSVDAPVAVYRFTGEAGDRITADASVPNTNTYFTISRIDALGNRNALIGSQYERERARIGVFTLPESGEYTVEVYTQYIADSFDMTLTLDEVMPVPIAYGEVVEGVMTGDGSALYYSFDAVYGDMIDIRVESDDLDTVLWLYNQYGILYTDDDAGAYYNPEILRQFINEDGEHIIRLVPFAPDVEGPFTLTVERSSGYLLDDGPQTVTFEKPNSNLLAFTAEAGETVRLNLSTEVGILPFLNVSQRMVNLINLGTGDLQTVSVDFTVPEAGVVLVRLDRNYSTGAPTGIVEVNLERLDD